MWLININNLQLQAFGDRRPPYAILSHRWRDGELSFQYFQDPARRNGQGFEKICRFCQLIQSMNHHAHLVQLGAGAELGLPPPTTIDWAWVDTVCIDKTSSAVLSEAINSMWTYYEQCHICVAYLDDVSNGMPYKIRNSEWFLRGWTLLELLAPHSLLFCDRLWRELGTREELAKAKLNFHGASPLLDATGIEPAFLTRERPFRLAPVAQRMSWAAKRKTSRGENMAYCLMGLFDVNMPLLYGEGQEKAFLRLQGEIIRNSGDESIFAFSRPTNSWCTGALAMCPADFVNGGLIRRCQQIDRAPYTVTQKALRIEGPAILVRSSMHHTLYIIKLNCIQIMDMTGPDWSQKSHKDSQYGQCCILGVQKRGNVHVRRPKFEEEVLEMTSREVDECIRSGTWRKIEMMVFFITLSERDAKENMSNSTQPDFWEQPNNGKGKRRCDGPWFVGLPGR